MLEAYLERDMCDQAVFEFFVRRLPEQRNFLMAAGLEQLLDYLEDLSFSDEEIGWLESTGEFSSRLIGYLAAFRFTGDVLAMPEGTVFFADEPVVQTGSNVGPTGARRACRLAEVSSGADELWR